MKTKIITSLSILLIMISCISRPQVLNREDIIGSWTTEDIQYTDQLLTMPEDIREQAAELAKQTNYTFLGDNTGYVLIADQESKFIWKLKNNSIIITEAPAPENENIIEYDPARVSSEVRLEIIEIKAGIMRLMQKTTLGRISISLIRY